MFLRHQTKSEGDVSTLLFLQGSGVGAVSGGQGDVFGSQRRELDTLASSLASRPRRPKTLLIVLLLFRSFYFDDVSILSFWPFSDPQGSYH